MVDSLQLAQACSCDAPGKRVSLTINYLSNLAFFFLLASLETKIYAGCFSCYSFGVSANTAALYFDHE